MVQVLKIQEWKNAKEIEGKKDPECGSLNKISMAYFVALANYIALKEKIPTGIVIRSSFGHNIPSVADTKDTFRINVGIISKVYAEKVLVKSLNIFNQNIKEFFERKNELAKLDLDNINKMIEEYNQIKQKHNVQIWTKGDSIFEVLCKIGDSSGKKVSFQITRFNQYIDLLANYVFEELLKLNENWNGIETNRIYVKPFVKAMKRMLIQLQWKKKFKKTGIVEDIVATLIVENEQFYNAEKIKFDKRENVDIKKDEEFWNIISKIFEKQNRNDLSCFIRNGRMFGLYKQLENGNLNFILQSTNQQSDDGYGSDSDYEFDVHVKGKKKCHSNGKTVFDLFDNGIYYEKITCYSKKITLATGMRAINCSHFVALIRTGAKMINTDYMYYETASAVKKVRDQVKDLNLNYCGKFPQKIVRYIDLNHCNASGNDWELELEKIANEVPNNEDIIVLDYTSATTKRIQEAIQVFLSKVNVLLLVSSGIKNEQIGADINPYGTLRIITKEVHTLTGLYRLLRNALSELEILPKQSHNIRKSFKAIGAVVTSKMIFSNKRDRSMNCNRNESDCNDKSIEDIDKETKQIFDQFFSGQHEKNLTSINNYKSIANVTVWTGLDSANEEEFPMYTHDVVEGSSEMDPNSIELLISADNQIRRYHTEDTLAHSSITYTSTE